MKTATLASITQNRRVLLGLKRGNPEIGDGIINAPGGKQEPGETLIECLVRETKEEVGIVLDPDQVEQVAIVTFYADDIPDFEVHIFRTSTFSGKLRDTKSMVPNWYAIEELPIERMHESDRVWFSRVIQGKKFRAHVRYRERGKGFLGIKFFPY